MKITILAVGKKHDPKLLAAIEDYTKRLSHYTSIDWKLIEAKITGSMTEAQIKATESSAILSYIANKDVVVLLDERGLQLTSPALAEKFQNFMNSGVKQVVIVIGGAYGVTEDLMQRADFIWSLSKLVLPHQLVRLVLAEQLYRVHTILAGEKYHHD